MESVWPCFMLHILIRRRTWSDRKWNFYFLDPPLSWDSVFVSADFSATKPLNPFFKWMDFIYQPESSVLVNHLLFIFPIPICFIKMLRWKFIAKLQLAEGGGFWLLSLDGQELVGVGKFSWEKGKSSADYPSPGRMWRFGERFLRQDSFLDNAVPSPVKTFLGKFKGKTEAYLPYGNANQVGSTRHNESGLGFRFCVTFGLLTLLNQFFSSWRSVGGERDVVPFGYLNHPQVFSISTSNAKSLASSHYCGFVLTRQFCLFPHFGEINPAFYRQRIFRRLPFFKRKLARNYIAIFPGIIFKMFALAATVVVVKYLCENRITVFWVLTPFSLQKTESE